MSSKSNHLFCLLFCGSTAWSGLSWVVLLILAGLTYVCVSGQLLSRLWAGWTRRASARMASLCSTSIFTLPQASPLFLTCQATRQASRRAGWKLARPPEARAWNWHSLASVVFYWPRQVNECILADAAAAGRQFYLVSDPGAVLSPIPYMPCFSPCWEDLPSLLFAFL